ncbi:hypothetical protein COB21_05690 [Candidatus Aerophobetes bacterium]|uniref:Uncharacterized protein n=1 Tax=Aerophobetes bacterium TaxID=2030807 RepID=A0A2A4X011_UNCAE|nr:MAG: hypothetical protein COB21_05690 [Candidatus Aerophobetes bacterium]
MKRVILGAVLGGIVSFSWMCISWGMLPWHHVGVSSFKNEDQVARVIRENTGKSGVYMLPYVALETLHRNVKEDVSIYKEQKKALKEYPLIFLQLNKNGVKDFSFLSSLASFLTQCVSVGFVAYLLTLLKLESSYLKRFCFCVIYGLSSAIFFQEPSWNWFGSSSAYTAIMIVDATITWALAGFVLAAIVKPRFKLRQML